MTSQERIVQIKPLWDKGLGVTQIGKIINLTIPNVIRYINIIYGKDREKRFISGPKKYSLNEHFFDIIDTEDKAYFLGLLYADGNLAKSQNSVRISLQEKDKQILEDFRISLSYTKPLVLIKRDHEKDAIRSNQYLLEISSSTFRKGCEKQGLTPAKSLTLKFPEKIPDNLIHHFIRGYFDGDGCIHINDKGGSTSVVIAGSDVFCIELMKFLKQKGIQCTFTKASAGKNCFYTRILGAFNIERFYDYCYNDYRISLQRKQIKFTQWRNNRKKIWELEEKKEQN